MGTAIYTRQSKDRTGHAEAVDRQERACRLMAQAKEWDEPVVYTDNDISATSGKRRPAFEHLLKDIESGEVDRVLVWHIDRLTRSMADLLRVIAAGKERKVNIACVEGQSLDLGDPTGVAIAQILTAIAAMEVAHKGERQKAANQQRAQKGKAFWTRRPFGYDRDDGTVYMVEAEAEAIRSGAEALLGGASLASVTADWNRRGLVTTYSKKGDENTADEGGKPWSLTSVKRVFLNPRYAGRRLYNGDDMGKGEWPAILTTEQSEALEALLTSPHRKTAPDDLSAKYLLSGIARCGRCGTPMYASPMHQKGRSWMIYQCIAKDCSRVARRLDLVDEVVESVLLARLSDPRLVSAWRSASDDVKELQRQLGDLRDRRDALADAMADGEISRPKFRERSGRLTREIAELESRIAQASVKDPVAALAAGDVEEGWKATPLEDRRKIVRSLMDIRILPAGKGIRFSPDQVQIDWK